jgi:protein-S-isoprenylcysteine O-methyltransferase Ste14
MTQATDRTPVAARVGQWVFPRRVLVPIPMVLIGLLIIHPRDVFGQYHALGLAVAALLVAAGVGLRIWAGGCAGNHTRTDTISAPQLTTGGPYAYVRNPIYLGNMILGIGMIGLCQDPWLLALFLPAVAILYVTIIPSEERFLRGKFGEAYDQFTENVPRLFPRLTPWEGRTDRPFDWIVLRGEAWIVSYLVVIYAAMMVARHFRS